MKTKEEKILVLSTELEKLSKGYELEKDLDEKEWISYRMNDIQRNICELIDENVMERFAVEFLKNHGYKGHTL